MKKLGILIGTWAILLLGQPLFGQERASFELRVQGDLATQDLGDAELKTGLGFEGILSYQFLDHVGAYAGWGWNKFAAEKSFAGENIDFEETGYQLGLQFQHPISVSDLSYYVRAGAIYNHLELEDGNDIIADSGHGWGWQIGLGVDLPISSKWHLRPGIKYQSLSRDVHIEGTTTELDLTYLSVGLGIALDF